MKGGHTLFLVGLTGGLASGKSTVAEMLAQSGLPVVNADRIGHELFEKDRDIRERVVALLGTGILDPQGGIDRQKVASAVFSDRTLMTRLEAILHPAIGDEIRKRVWALAKAGHGVVVIEVPLLFESGWDSLMDLTVVVDCPPAEQVRRFLARGGVSEEEAKRRIASQMARSERLQRASVVLDNSGRREALEAGVRRLLELIEERKAGH
jgi:dephospho-CoA kinase